MSYEDEVDPQRITRGMRDRIEALISTSDMIDVLVGEALTMLHAMRVRYKDLTVFQYRDWHIIAAFLRLAIDQNEIVKNAAGDFAEKDASVAA